MSDPSSTAQRLIQVKNLLAHSKQAASNIPWDPNCSEFPSRGELPKIDGAPHGAAWVWGRDDQLGRLNLLTPSRVLSASKEVRQGDIVPLNLPLDMPKNPAFKREAFQHDIKTLAENIAYDDIYHLNTQSGTQWDGFRHFAHRGTGSFYNGTKGADIVGPAANLRGSVHYWPEHGIAGRGILLDYRSYADEMGIHYDSFDEHRISYDELYHCGKYQGIDIRPEVQGGNIRIGDILFVRSGWVQQYHTISSQEQAKLASRKHQKYAGLAQNEEIKDWLHDCYFAAVAGDSPTFEAWPTNQDYYLHEYILALWGMPLGEMVDLERLSRRSKELNKYTFFFTSAPANCPGGVASHLNALAIY